MSDIRLPARVFNISPHRSGTRSFHSFCCAHGLRSTHWCGAEVEAQAKARLESVGAPATQETLWWAFIDYYQAGDVFCDLPTPICYEGAMANHSGEKFIFLRRDPAIWVRSVRRLKGGDDLTFAERIFYESVTHKHAVNLSDYSDEDLGRGYSEYVGRVLWNFTERKQDLLFLNLDDEHVGKRLSNFMGFTQLYPFPREG
jgi:hypothetical protein